MRHWITLAEDAMAAQQKLLGEVRAFVKHIGHGQWEFPDDADLIEQISTIKQQIDYHALSGAFYTIERVELRPEDELPETLQSIGCHWSFESGAAHAYHHDNAIDNFGEGNFSEILVYAKVTANDIDWPYTFATNLIHEAEKEVTLLSNRSIVIESYWLNDMEHPVDMRAHTDGYYDTD